MTKYVAEQIGLRQGRRANQVQGKDYKKAMAMFKKTGRHPLIEAAREENVKGALTALPTVDKNRPHVFMDIEQKASSDGPGFKGRLVIELFEDLFPALGAAFRNRCQEGHHTIRGTVFERVSEQLAAFGGRSKHASADSFSSMPRGKLQHTDPGLLSVSVDGSHFALTLGRALQLDEKYLVVGRVGKGEEVLPKLSSVHTVLEGEPLTPIRITQCGITDHMGNNEVFGEGEDVQAGNKLKDAAAAKQGMLEASDMVKDALKQGLKRGRPDSTAKGTNGAGPSRRKKQMGELSSDDDDEEDGDDDGE